MGLPRLWPPMDDPCLVKNPGKGLPGVLPEKASKKLDISVKKRRFYDQRARAVNPHRAYSGEVGLRSSCVEADRRLVAPERVEAAIEEDL